MAASTPNTTASTRDRWAISGTERLAKLAIYPSRVWTSNWSIIIPWTGMVTSQITLYAPHTGQ